MDAWRERGNKRTSLVMSMYGDGAVSEFGLDGNPDDSWHFNVSARTPFVRLSYLLTLRATDLPPGRERWAVDRVSDTRGHDHSSDRPTLAPASFRGRQRAGTDARSLSCRPVKWRHLALVKCAAQSAPL
jgi:hypothetical protein